MQIQTWLWITSQGPAKRVRYSQVRYKLVSMYRQTSLCAKEKIRKIAKFQSSVKTNSNRTTTFLKTIWANKWIFNIFYSVRNNFIMLLVHVKIGGNIFYQQHDGTLYENFCLHYSLAQNALFSFLRFLEGPGIGFDWKGWPDHGRVTS